MPSIDELRGAPEGSTKNSAAASKTLREAAATVGLAMTTVMPVAAETSENQQQEDSTHKIEVVVENQTPEKNGETYYVPAEGDEVQKAEELKVMSDAEAYGIEGADGEMLIFTKNELNGRKIEREENRAHRESSSQPLRFEEVRIDKVEDLASQTALADYQEESNTITLYHTDLTPEDLKQKVENSVEKNETVDTHAYDAAYQMASTLEQVENTPELRESIIEHEKTHGRDHESGAMKSAQITQEHAACLNMATEINATMTQVKLSYDKYKESGNVDDIIGWHAGDLKEFKEWLKQNPNSPDAELKLAAAVYKGWLDSNNQPGTQYFSQAQQSAGLNSSLIMIDERQGGAKFENDASLAQYHKQWDKIFANTAFGDVRSVVKPDFDLGKGSQLRNFTQDGVEQSAAEKFLNKVVDGAKNVRQATRKLKNFFHQVKKIDKDGVRTEKEQQKLKKIFMLIQQKRGVTKYVQAGVRTESKERVQSNTNAVVQKAVQESAVSSR